MIHITPFLERRGQRLQRPTCALCSQASKTHQSLELRPWGWQIDDFLVNSGDADDFW